MSDEDKKTYRQLLLIAVLCICAILFLFALGTLYAEHACIQLWLGKTAAMPDFCDKGGMQKFVLEFVGLVIGMLAAVKLLGGGG
jgi:hypothetical protein